MSVRKKRPSAADVLRQEMQQPLVLPPKEASNPPHPPTSQPNPTTPNVANMSQPNDAATAANIKAIQETEAKLKQEIEDLKSKLTAQSTELKDAKKLALELSAPSKAPAKSTAITKANSTKSNSSLTARPTQTREQTAIRRANTDIGWLD